ncbi:MAG TPA: hypothetical protein VMF56_09750 [Acidobacteriaceae bacterium]|nr:hypothetical protein [Acidobacteriaceae bacterium]
MPDGKCAGDQAQRDEDYHAPNEGRGFGDAQNGGAERDCQQAQNAKAHGPTDEIDDCHAPQGVTQCAGRSNDHSKGKGRRSEASDGDGDSRAIPDSLLQLVELFLPGNFADAFLSKFASDLGQQENSYGRSAGGGKNIEEKSGMVVCDQADDQEIVSKRQYEEGRIEDAKDKGAEIAKMKQKMQQRPKPMRHEGLFLAGKR